MTAPAGQHARPDHAGAPAAPDALRLWLRLLGCTTTIEKRLRRRLEREFATTLPRFDVLAALDRHPHGLTLSALSRLLLVSNGNVTGLTRTLAAEGLVALSPAPHDRRVTIATLTPAGRAGFAALAAAHHGLVETVFAGLPAGDRAALYHALAPLKATLAEPEDCP